MKQNGKINNRTETYLDKERQLIKKICENNGQPMFDSKDEGLEFLESQLKAFPNYVNKVVAYQVTMPVIHERYDGQELRDRVMSLDSSRKMAHDTAISSLNILNQLCTKLDLEPFAQIDTTDRHAVADFVGRYVNETYNEGIGGTMDMLAYEKRNTYNASKTHDRILKLQEEGLTQGNTPDTYQPEL